MAANFTRRTPGSVIATPSDSDAAAKPPEPDEHSETPGERPQGRRFGHGLDLNLKFAATQFEVRRQARPKVGGRKRRGAGEVRRGKIDEIVSLTRLAATEEVELIRPRRPFGQRAAP